MDIPAENRFKGGVPPSSPPLLAEDSFHETLRRAVVWPIAALTVTMALLLGLLIYFFITGERADHSNKVLGQLSRVEKLVVDMETGVRGYRITGDPKSLEPFHQATAEFSAQLNALAILVRGDVVQSRELGALRHSHKAWSELVTNVRERVQSQPPTDIALHLRAKELMDALRASIAAMQSHERQLLANSSAMRGRLRAITIAGASLAAIIFTPLLAASVRRALRRVNASYRTVLRSVEAEREWLSVTLSSIGDAVAATDEQGRTTYLNPVAEQLTGWTSREAMGKPLASIFNLIHEVSRQAVKNPVEEVLREGRVVELAIHTVLVARDGRETPIADSAAPIRDHSGAIIGVVLVFRDESAVRERRRVEDERKRFVSLAENSSDFIGMCDTKFQPFFVNPAGLAMVGLDDLEQACRTPLQEFFFPEDQDKMMKDFLPSVIASGNGEIEVRFRHFKTGAALWVLHNVWVVTDDDGQFAGLATVSHDITESKRAGETRARLAAIVESSEDAIVSKDLNGVIQSWNRGAERIFGYKAQEAIGRPVTMLMPEDRVDEEPGILERIRRGEMVDHYETVRRRKDGKLLDVSLRISPIVDAEGHIVGASKIARDITERRQAEEALRKSEERYRSLFESIDEGFCVIEMIFAADGKPVDYRFIEVNPAFERQAGMHDVAGKRMLEFVSAIEPHWLENYARVARTGEPMRFADEYKSLAKWFDVYAFRVGDPQNHRIAVIFTDITERKQTEDALLRSRAELAAANQQLDSLVEKRTAQWRETVQQLETFSYSIVHDLRAPLRSMRSFAGFLHQDYHDKLDSNARDYLRRIMDSSARMDALITDVLSYSRVNQGATDLAPVDLDRLIPEIIEQYPNLQDKRRFISVEGPLPKVAGNDALLTQIFSNLIGNALKFVAEGNEPRVRIYSQRNGDRERIWIEDQGIGISADQHEKIFGLFQRLHRPDEFPGTGVGLAIVKRAVERMGGTTGVESEAGKGSRFWIELRRAEVPPTPGSAVDPKR